ncbi:MAG: phosphotransferase [Bifidobacteriaceae bacterium]|jgi:predicted unusual protein kinase regulating ubiquinone biosynthesis (AarF/ABC1/UbiB family)|nr:phosphotransferase [Bifidobacteriaceae bacterium]
MAKDFSRLTGMARYRATLALAVRFAWQLWWLAKTARWRRPDRLARRRHRLYAEQARTFTRLASEMGGLVIKLGQHISTRVDLLPTEYTIELAKLQDAVPPVAVSAIKAEIERELGADLGDIYARFDDEPVAAASLGQVHRAWLADGTPVAVKVLRPGIEDLVETDLRSLKVILRWLGRLTSVGGYLDLDMFYGEFSDTLLAELDMMAEGANAEKFQESFLFNPNVDMPRIYWHQTTRRVLTMEFMEGVKINALEQLDAAGIDRQRLARHLLEIYLRMVLEDGFFHADPHPGNILVRSDGVILLLDFGMVGTVPDNLSRDIPALALALFSRDWRHAADLLSSMGFLREGADPAVLAIALEPMVSRVLGASRGQSSLDREAVEQLRSFMYSQPFQLPGRIAFLGKTLINLVGTALQLDPKMNLMDELVPLVRDSMAANSGGASSGFGRGSDPTGLSALFAWLLELTGLSELSGLSALPGLPGFDRLSDWAEQVGLDSKRLASVLAAINEARSLAAEALPTARNIVEVSAKANRGELETRLAGTSQAGLTRVHSEQTGRLVRTVIGSTVTLGGIQVLAARPASRLGKVVGAGLAGLGALVMGAQTLRQRR